MYIFVNCDFSRLLLNNHLSYRDNVTLKEVHSMNWRSYILLAVPFLLLSIFIAFVVPEKYSPLAFIPVGLFWVVYYIIMYLNKKKKNR